MVLMPFRTVLPQTEDGLVLYITANEGAGVMSCDESSMGNCGSIGTSTWADGLYGNALRFDGDDYVEIPHSPSLDLPNSLTILVRFKVYSFPTLYAVFLYKHSLVYGLGIRSDKYVYLAFDSSTWVVGPVNFTLNKWHQISFTADGSTLKIYFDADLVYTGSKSAPYITSTNPIRLGTNEPLSDQYLDGLIDEVKIYNRVLSAEEIKAHFKGAVIKLRP